MTTETTNTQQEDPNGDFQICELYVVSDPTDGTLDYLRTEEEAVKWMQTIASKIVYMVQDREDAEYLVNQVYVAKIVKRMKKQYEYEVCGPDGRYVKLADHYEPVDVVVPVRDNN